MPLRFNFDGQILSSVVGGSSAVDLPKLNIHSFGEAQAFIYGYGFDLNNQTDLERLWYFYRRALVLITEKLGYSLEQIPSNLKDRKSLEDIRQLLIWASSSLPRDKELQKWSCAILRCMHVFVHAENDLFGAFSEEIQKQILGPFQDRIFHDGSSGATILKRLSKNLGENETLPLAGFDVKPFKTSTSTVIKLLAKPDALAMSVFDKLGVRFITNSMFDSFRVVRFLVEENLISYPHIIPDQSSNNIYPVDLFFQACSDLVQMSQQDPLNPSSQWSEEQVNEYFRKYLAERESDAGFIRKENAFSGADYRFIKFIARKLVRVSLPGEAVGFSFFYPFEVQIMDQESHSRILSGPSHHQAYKDRQKIAARKRLDPQSL
jgi:uncharacterized protein (TIGR04562 family)